jgi:hypothetical protein
VAEKKGKRKPYMGKALGTLFSSVSTFLTRNNKFNNINIKILLRLSKIMNEI